MCNKAASLDLGVLPHGTREILGTWIESIEGAEFWLKVFKHLRTHGVSDTLIEVTDGLQGGGAKALAAAFLATTLQTCIVHLIRNSPDLANWKDGRPLTQSLRPIYLTPSAEAGQARLDIFEEDL